MPDFANGSIAIISIDVEQNGDAARTVAFEGELLVVNAGEFTGAALLISLMRRVKILPRLASSAPFLCLIVAHLEWPDIAIPRVRYSEFC
jgi:hypothetical protein